jgi:hypothetical protein
MVFRFFGRESTLRYEPIARDYISTKIKYIFSYPQSYLFEKKYTNFFNDNNTYVVNLGLSNLLINKIINTYSPKNKKICFIVSHSNRSDYYKNIFLQFKKEFINHNYVILGRNNLADINICDDLDNDNYYKKISECKMLYYHSKEERHLHYHPFEAICIGMPVLFYKESLLSSYLPDSPGKCNDINDVYFKVNLILNNDETFISKIITEQNKIIDRLSIRYNNDIFKDVLRL